MPSDARAAVVRVLIPAVERFPDLPLDEPDLSDLGGPDVALATAIHRTVLQRWLTLDHLLSRHVRGGTKKLDPVSHAVLLTGAAQLIFLDRLPAYAVVDQSVRLAKKMGQARSAGLINAVLRKLDGLVVDRSDEPWTAAAHRLPRANGGTLVLREPALPKPDNLLAHTSVAASVPLPLLQRWFKQFGRDHAVRLACATLNHPPTYVVENETARVWDGPRQELNDWLAEDPRRRVQDPASLASVAAAADLSPTPRTVLDLCAGRGTKTRQLAEVFPDATITAGDPHPDRFADLQRVADTLSNVETFARLDPDRRFDLVVLDVPCSNTGVLSRRPGAKYRLTQTNLTSLVELQRQIIRQGLDRLASDGHLLYCTCSVEPEENERQTDWLIEHADGLDVKKQGGMLPSGTAAADEAGGLPHHDGSYHALVGPAELTE
jgi:16S rRNA (cytosine967-C5)-methyltransferase